MYQRLSPRPVMERAYRGARRACNSRLRLRNECDTFVLLLYRGLMPGKQAKILLQHHAGALLKYASTRRNPKIARVIVLLSLKAGMRAGEIANLTWDMIITPSGDINSTIELRDSAAKKRSGRKIPVHPDLYDALGALSGLDRFGPVILSERAGPMQANSIVAWFARAYAATGLEGCSSHSGRRTFITQASRKIHLAGGSLRDVQLLVGQASERCDEDKP
jgi:integrase